MDATTIPPHPFKGRSKMNTYDLDLTITKISNRNRNAGGSWVRGKINDEYRFEVLVFADHAEQESFELNRSKISKLWIQRLADKKTMFNFDRGLDVPAANTEIQVVVDFLCEGLSDLVFGG
ncbi:DUF7678 domain-containing protein [Pirellulaceae bacterium SH449]